MNFEQWRFLLFSIFGLGGIVVFAIVGTGRFSEERIDRHTGQSIPMVKSAVEALQHALRGRNAREILQYTTRARRRWAADAALKEAEAILIIELELPDGEVFDQHPARDQVRIERILVGEFKASLEDRHHERLAHEDLLPLLRGLEGDDAIGKATEALFLVVHSLEKEKDPEGEVVCGDCDARRLRQLLDADASQVRPEAFIEVAGAFLLEGRARGRMRWLLNAYEHAPHDTVVRDALVTAYLQQGRNQEAFAVLGAALAAGPVGTGVWEQRARIAAWVGHPLEEAEALKETLRAGDNAQVRERLIEIYRYIGRPEDALDHARVLARDAEDEAMRKRPVLIAVEAGMVEEAFRILEDLARRSAEPRHWREWIIELALDDLRADRAVEELEKLHEIYPGQGYGKQLESLYRRLYKHEDLVDFLEQRLDATPDDGELEKEVLSLHISLGHRTSVRKILLRRFERAGDPEVFFSQLRNWHALEIENVVDKAREIIEGPRLEPRHVEGVAGHLRPFFGEKPYVELAWILAGRHVDAPGARELYVELIDRAETPERRARLAMEVARKHEGDDALTKTWMERAAWAGLLDDEITARESLLLSRPDDLENRNSLGDLYEAVGRHEDAAEQWRFLAKREGPASDAVLRLVGALFQLREVEEAMQWLERRASLPSTTLEDRLEVAEQLFGSQKLDRALVFYAAVLDEDPTHPVALLRIGQIRSWSNDPNGALTYLQKLHETTKENRETVEFYLGEAYWGLGETDKARAYHESAVPALIAIKPRTLEQESMLAKALTRLGRTEEAVPLFERLLEAYPNGVDLILDYADAMKVSHRLGEARALVRRARAIEPQNRRALRLEAQVHMEQRSYTKAVPILRETLDTHGPDAGLEADLGYALELTGDWEQAVDAYDRSLTLQPTNLDIAQSRRRLSDFIEDAAGGFVQYRKVGEDRTFDIEGSVALKLVGDRTTFFGGLGYSSLSGRAQAVDNGTTDIKTEYVSIRAGFSHRHGRANRIGGGLDAYPGVNGNFPMGAWASYYLEGTSPFGQLTLHGFYNRLFRNPSAAAGLGGRSSGAAVSGYREFGSRVWISGLAQYQRLSIEDPIQGEAKDPYFDGYVSVGYRIFKGSAAVSEGLYTNRLPHGPFSADLYDARRRTEFSVWATYNPIRLLGDEELANLLPIGARFDYVSVSGRVDLQIQRGLGAKLEGTYGKNVDVGGETFWNIDAALTWRPHRWLELYGGMAFGISQGRTDDSDSIAARFGLTYRW